MNDAARLCRSGLAAALFAVVALFASPAALFADNPPPAAGSQTTAKTTDYIDLLQRVFREVEKNYVDKPDPKKLFEGAMKGLFESLGDPHSYYLTQSFVKDFTDTTRGRFGGVGIIISKPAPAGTGGASSSAEGSPKGSSEPPYVQVITPIHGTPAYKAGISAGDRITEIDGESTAPMTIDEVVNKLRGAPGTDVKLTILRGADITFNVSLMRATIEVPVVKDAMIPPHIGYIRIIQYTPLTPQKVRDAVESLKKQGATSFIIDERGNPGGLLSAVVATTDYFLSSGVIVSTRSRISSDNEVFTADESTLVPDSFPIIVLIDKGSASAAEIFAGALKDHHRALLVGETSYGKGSVQQVFFLRGANGAFKLTTAKYYTPNGKNIDKIGIKPNIVVKEPELTKAEQEDLKKLLEQNAIANFVRGNPNADALTIDSFVSRLKSEGIRLPADTLKRLIHNEMDRMQNNPPVYDLTYDKVLSEAVKLLRTGQYPAKGD